MTLINDTQSLATFCKPLHETEFITVDTEFMREKTYWPELCLIQIAGPENFAAIDPRAAGIELAPLFELLTNANVTKVFHAARQDLEIFLHLMGEMPKQIFDTQIAAMVCGFGDAVGYDHLIAKLTKVQLDKSPRFTDWSIRPLSERQIKYALADVTHLREAYKKLSFRLNKENRHSWITEEMALLTNPATYYTDPGKAYKKIKGRGKNLLSLAILRELAAWRENEARRRNVPRNRVIRDEVLVEISHQKPHTTDTLSRTRGLNTKTAHGSIGKQILHAINKGVNLPEADWPKLEAKPKLPKGIGPTTDLLKVLLKKVTEETQVAGRLIAKTSDIELIAGFGDKADVLALSGWRREIFGLDALKLCEGKTALAIDNNKLITEER
ncbi:MAG: ribonuclease D [Magnetovibrio sp.]|nr:ribonuclease D [Magnetovibrio sp.]